VLTGRPHSTRFLGHVGLAHSALVAPLFWFFLPRSFSEKNNGCVFLHGSFGIQKVLKHQKHGKREFYGSEKLNATNRNFLRKSHKSYKTCKNNNITMQITFQYDNIN
jgi:hypothetical protein